VTVISRRPLSFMADPGAPVNDRPGPRYYRRPHDDLEDPEVIVARANAEVLARNPDLAALMEEKAARDAEIAARKAERAPRRKTQREAGQGSAGE
jgi:outer membrane protein TolC